MTQLGKNVNCELQQKRNSPQKGCLWVVVLVFVALGLMVQGAIKQFNVWFATYTATAPRVLPQPSGTDEQIDQVLEKVAFFAEELRLGQASAPLVLSADEINLWLYYHPDAEMLAETVRISIKDDLLQAEVSLPLSNMGEWGKGRYLNGTVIIDLSVVSGRLMVFLQGIEVGNKPITKALLEQIREVNLAEDLNNDLKYSEWMRSINLVYVKSGELWIVP